MYYTGLQNLIDMTKSDMSKYNKSFKYWKTQEVEKVFGVKRAKDKTQLLAWESADYDISEHEKAELLYLQKDLIDQVEYWNEAALKFFFLAPLFRIVRYKSDIYSSFLEQRLELQLEETVTIGGKIDFLVALGYQLAEVPFFTLHEYKPEPEFTGDPNGQLLIAMIAAQKANRAKGFDHPLYGVYVTGRFWFFVILDGDKYVKSLAYDATKSDLFSIYKMLQHVKVYIDKEVSLLV